MNKYTYVDALNEVLSMSTLSEQAREKLTALRDQTEKRNTSHSGKPTAKQVANSSLADDLFNLLVALGVPCTVSECMAAGEPFSSMSNQKVSALMRTLVSDGRVEKTVDKRKSYFKAIAD